MLVNGEMQIARFSFSAFRFTEQQNQTVSTYYIHCITRLCEISTCSAFRVKTFNLYFAFILFFLELANYNLYKLSLGKLETPFGLGWVGCCFLSLSIYSGFAKLCYFGGIFEQNKKKQHIHSVHLPRDKLWPRHFLDSSCSMALSTAMWQTKKERRCAFDHHSFSKWSHRIQNHHITSHPHTCR